MGSLTFTMLSSTGDAPHESDERSAAMTRLAMTSAIPTWKRTAMG